MPIPRTFKQLYSEVLAWTADADDTSTMRDLAKRSVAASHARRMAGTRWTFLIAPTAGQIALVPGQQVYALHDTFHTPLLFRLRSSDDDLTLVPYDQLNVHLPEHGSESAGPPTATLAGMSPVQQQPSAASVLTCTSSSSSDNGKQITIEGDTAAGVVSETLTLPNAGSVQFTEILSVRKDTETWVGTITLVDASANTLLTLAPTCYGRQFRLLQTLAIPTAADIIDYRWFRAPRVLTSDYDLPNTPAPFEQIHVYDALLDLQGYTRATAAEIRNWEDHREMLAQDLAAAYQEGLALGGAGSYVTYVPR